MQINLVSRISGDLSDSLLIIHVNGRTHYDRLSFEFVFCLTRLQACLMYILSYGQVDLV